MIASIAAAMLPGMAHAQTIPGAVVNSASTTETRSRAIECLATALAYEAGYEPLAGQQAVAEVILNRLRHPAFPKSVCGVVFAGSTRRTGCQFSFTCDGSLKRQMTAAMLAGTRAVAAATLDGLNPVRAPGATHYHADYVSPYWAPSLIRIAKIGAHIFYRGAGGGDYGPGAKAYTGFAASPVDGDTGNSSGSGSVSGAPRIVTVPTIFAPWGLLPSPPANR